MDNEDNADMGFQRRGGDGILNCHSSIMSTYPLSEKDAGMLKSSNGVDPFFSSGWDALVSHGQSENFGGSSMVPHSEFIIENQPISNSSHLIHYQSGSGLGEMVTKLSCFGSGSFSEMVSSFGLPECGQIASSGCPSNYALNKEGGKEKTSTDSPHSQEECQISEEGVSPDGKKKRRAPESHSSFTPNKNVEGEQPKDPSRYSSESLKEQKKQKIEQNISANLRGKQTSKQAKENSDSGEAPKDNYIHMRAKRGQATNSHSLAERVRREKISERMRLLQELVPGCNKVTGKAVMLDEIINYVQSLQQQVEFLSMKLATVNPELNIDIERILSKEILHSRGSNAASLEYGPGLNSSHPYPQGTPQRSLPGFTNTIPPFHHMPKTVWNVGLQSLHMGFDSTINNLGPSERSKLEL